MSSLDVVRARFARNEGLPFADVLTETSIRDVLEEHGVKYRDRVYSPVTLLFRKSCLESSAAADCRF